MNKNLFVDRRHQLKHLERWNDELQLGFSREDFREVDNLQTAPPWPAGDTSVTVLVPYRETPQETYSMLWAIIHRYNPQSQRSDTVNKEGQLRLHAGSRHPTKGLHWERINLAGIRGAHFGLTVRQHSQDTSASFPHAGVLAAAAHFPNWIEAIGAKTQPYACIAGYEINDMKASECWSHVPIIDADENTCYLSIAPANRALFEEPGPAIPTWIT